MPKRAVVAIAVVVALLLLAAAVLLGARAWRDTHRSTLQQALDYAPADAERLSWTDWAGVRDAVGADLGADSRSSAIQRFLDQGYDRDLTSTSALVQSAPALQAHYGFSPATVTWELFSQARRGAAVIMRLPGGTDFDAIGDQLEHTGFTRPRDDDGVWIGGEELLAGIGGLTPELQYVALDPDDGLVVTSDDAGYLQQVVDDHGDDVPDALRDVVAASGDPLSAAVYAGDYVCSALAMSGADSDDQATAERLVEEAGGVDPMTAFAMSAQPSGHVRVVMGFESEDQARSNADSRAELAAGPAPGQGGDFSDRFSVASVTADHRQVTFDLVPRKHTYVLSDLSTGPVLFATC